MSKKKRGCPQGHYCKICGEYKANEKFSGKGHAVHICKVCSQLSAAEQAEAMTINRLMNFPMGRLSASDRGWLKIGCTISAPRWRRWRRKSIACTSLLLSETREKRN